MSEPAFNPQLTFADLGVRGDLVRALARRGIVHPFPIQEISLPDSLAGRDVLGRGRTGSGKTVAFALPAISRLLDAGARREPRRPRALVLVPTRELAVQVNETVEYLADAVRLKTMTVFGGVRYTGQVTRLERGVDFVIATPGRLEDLIAQGHLDLSAVGVTVLDEADLMADMGFMPSVTRILDQVPAGGQRLLFSATLDNEVGALVDGYLHDPLVHSVTTEEPADDTTHYLFLVDRATKAQVVREMLAGGGRTLAFARTKFGAERIARELTADGIPALDLHGNLSQARRQRHLSSFAEGRVSVLVATDIAARGIHVDDIGLVVHLDPPADPKAFLHRSGRTARAGATGNVVTLATKNQNKMIRSLMARARIKPTQAVVAPGDELIERVRAPRVAARAAGPSIFEPDPEDAAEDTASGRDRRPRDGRGGPRSRPARQGRRSEHGPRWGDVPRGDRAAHRNADAWDEFRAGDSPRRARRADDRRGGERDRRSGADRLAYPRRDDRRTERPTARGGRPGDGRDGRDFTPRVERPAPSTEDRRRPRFAGQRQDDRPNDRRPDRPVAQRERRPSGKKTRWTAEDHRKREQSAERGFGFTKKDPRAARAGRAGTKGKPGKNVLARKDRKR